MTQLGRRYEFDQQHAQHVAKLALQIFDATKRIHKLGSEARLVLEAASLLHDVGYFINSNDHHKHSGYIITASSIVGIQEDEKRLVAAVARYHRGGMPSLDHREWQNLRPPERHITTLLAGILRIVEELDKEHLRRVSQVKTSISRGAVTLNLRGSGALLVELWGAEKRKLLLEQALKKRIIIKVIR